MLIDEYLLAWLSMESNIWVILRKPEWPWEMNQNHIMWELVWYKNFMRLCNNNNEPFLLLITVYGIWQLQCLTKTTVISWKSICSLIKAKKLWPVLLPPPSPILFLILVFPHAQYSMKWNPISMTNTFIWVMINWLKTMLSRIILQENSSLLSFCLRKGILVLLVHLL